MIGNNLRLRIFLTGVGGQGTLLASRLLGEAALAAGYSPLVSETHGMAQRGGVVVSTVVLGDLKSPIISPGEADVLLGFEALEGFRALDRCHSRTLVIANTAAIVPYPVAIGKSTYPDVNRLLEIMAGEVGGLLAFDGGDPPGWKLPDREHGPAGGPGNYAYSPVFRGRPPGPDPP